LALRGDASEIVATDLGDDVSKKARAGKKIRQLRHAQTFLRMPGTEISLSREGSALDPLEARAQFAAPSSPTARHH
jgi:hypothetical protein